MILALKTKKMKLDINQKKKIAKVYQNISQP